MSASVHLPSLLRLRECYADRPQGGPRLLDWLSRPRLDRAAAAESIEFSTDPARRLVIAEGPLAGESLAALLDRFRDELGGRLLAELLDRELDLETRFACADAADFPVRALLAGKDPVAEAVTVLDAAPGACLYAGRRRNLPEDRFVSCLRQDPGAELLQEHAAEPGSALLLPAGMPWVLGRGALAHVAAVKRAEGGAVEGRNCAGLRGPAAEALRASVHFSRLLAKSRGWLDGLNAVTWLYAAGQLCSARLDLRAAMSWPRRPGESLTVVSGLSGSALVFAEGQMETLGRGRTVIVSADAASLRLNPESGGASVLVTWLAEPGPERDAPLLAHGFSRREIAGLAGIFGET